MSIALKGQFSNAPVNTEVEGKHLELFSILVFTGEYKKGGDASLAKTLEAYFKQTGRGTIDWVQVSGVPGFIFIYNYETSKLQVFESGKEGETFKELAEGEYPKVIRTESVAKMFAVGS